MNNPTFFMKPNLRFFFNAHFMHWYYILVLVSLELVLWDLSTKFPSSTFRKFTAPKLRQKIGSSTDRRSKVKGRDKTAQKWFGQKVEKASWKTEHESFFSCRFLEMISFPDSQSSKYMDKVSMFFCGNVCQIFVE